MAGESPGHFPSSAPALLGDEQLPRWSMLRPCGASPGWGLCLVPPSELEFAAGLFVVLERGGGACLVFLIQEMHRFCLFLFGPFFSVSSLKFAF